MELPDFQFEEILALAAELGAVNALVQSGQIKPYLKKSDAYKRYGRKNIEHWLESGQITPRKDGDASAAWRLSRIEIETLVKTLKLEAILAGMPAD
ncbi:hypothetical protein [Mucilaginibacter terrae]|uniref:DNA-binding protein n=1 Tax=Mucilaginibacter terrae TaxID=1955052 RepID=A0ABU3GNA3_9SPHI|nr:hypothetical protein [Mucilaginibacter terrae]MDT3401265.1 hypothetical protein [Mucilaginibacter terrae]